MSDAVLVTGAFGLVGTATVKHLAARGRHVVATDLDTPANRKAAAALPPGVTVRWTDLTDAKGGGHAGQQCRAGGDHPPGRGDPADVLRQSGPGPQGQRRGHLDAGERGGRRAQATTVRAGVLDRDLRAPQSAPHHRTAHPGHPGAGVRHLRRPQGGGRAPGARVRPGLGDPAVGRGDDHRVQPGHGPGHAVLRGPAAQRRAAADRGCARRRARVRRRDHRRRHRADAADRR